MDSFSDKIAVVTGGGTGMGRELVVQLATAGCHVSMCDVSEEHMLQTKELALKAAPAGTKVSCFVADVSDEERILAFRDFVMETHQTDCINLLFNNAGIGGTGSFINDSREEWEMTFNVCWGGVYYCCRAFMPLIVASTEGHVINTSSVNGFWASLGPKTEHTAYSASKFAVKGFTEALLTDCKLNAPHVGVSLVMPGHIGTSIILNSGKMLGHDPKELSEDDVANARERMSGRGLDLSNASDEDIKQGVRMMAEQFRDDAPMTAADAADVILQGVRDNTWRILVGEDAVALDRLVRADPEDAYTEVFMERLLVETKWAFTS